MPSCWGALLGPIDSSGAILASLARRAPGRAWSAWLRGSGLGFFFCLAGVSDTQHRGWVRSPVQSGCFRKGGVYLRPLVRESGTGQQRVQQAWPLLSSLPCLSIGTSHTVPRRRSREGFGRGLLSNPGWGQSGPAYKTPRFQSGPGKFLLAAGVGCCYSGEEVKLQGCSTEVLLVPG